MQSRISNELNCSIYRYIYKLFSNRILFSHDRFYPETFGGPKLSIKCLQSLDSEIICRCYYGVVRRDTVREKDAFFHSFLADTAICRRKKGHLLIKHKNCISLLSHGPQCGRACYCPNHRHTSGLTGHVRLWRPRRFSSSCSSSSRKRTHKLRVSTMASHKKMSRPPSVSATAQSQSFALARTLALEH